MNNRRLIACALFLFMSVTAHAAPDAATPPTDDDCASGRLCIPDAVSAYMRQQPEYRVKLGELNRHKDVLDAQVAVQKAQNELQAAYGARVTQRDSHHASDDKKDADTKDGDTDFPGFWGKGEGGHQFPDSLRPKKSSDHRLSQPFVVTGVSDDAASVYIYGTHRIVHKGDTFPGGRIKSIGFKGVTVANPSGQTRFFSVDW